MITSERVKDLYNEKALTYDRELGRLGYHDTLRNILRNAPIDLPEYPRILDIGCGPGLATEVMKNRFPDAHIIALDFAEEMIEIYKKRFPDVETLIGNFNEDEPFRENYFDLIVSTGAISEHGDDNAIKYAYDSLREKGQFVNIGMRKGLISLITRRRWHYNPFGKKDFLASCRFAGFREIKGIKVPLKGVPLIYIPIRITRFAIKAKK